MIEGVLWEGVILGEAGAGGVAGLHVEVAPFEEVPAGGGYLDLGQIMDELEDVCDPCPDQG